MWRSLFMFKRFAAIVCLSHGKWSHLICQNGRGRPRPCAWHATRFIARTARYAPSCRHTLRASHGGTSRCGLATHTLCCKARLGNTLLLWRRRLRGTTRARPFWNAQESTFARFSTTACVAVGVSTMSLMKDPQTLWHLLVYCCRLWIRAACSRATSWTNRDSDARLLIGWLPTRTRRRCDARQASQRHIRLSFARFETP